MKNDTCNNTKIRILSLLESGYSGSLVVNSGKRNHWISTGLSDFRTLYTLKKKNRHSI